MAKRDGTGEDEKEVLLADQETQANLQLWHQWLGRNKGAEVIGEKNHTVPKAVELPVTNGFNVSS